MLGVLVGTIFAQDGGPRDRLGHARGSRVWNFLGLLRVPRDWLALAPVLRFTGDLEIFRGLNLGFGNPGGILDHIVIPKGV